MRDIYDWRPQIDDSPTRRKENFPDIRDPMFWEFYAIGKRYSMLHVTGFFNIWSSVSYVCGRGIAGGFVECGVWLGGASLFAALAFDHFGQQRELLLYDTFAGFPKDSFDVKDGQKVRGPSYPSFRAAVEANLREHGVERFRIVEGAVEATLAEFRPAAISILRLDTDHYTSTKAEMDHLFPILSPGGVLIVDDYGLYEGSRRAVDEHLAAHGAPMMLARIDKGIRTGIK
ncbi:MAG: TylF/MycF/NovP-related O-methyltransferase [Sphingomonas sp.]